MARKILNKMHRLAPQIESFAHTARCYCAWVETVETYSFEEVSHLRLLLAELHLGVLRLWPVKPGADTRIKALSHEEWKVIYSKLARFELNHYWDVFNPLNSEDTTSICSSLADDLADIYRDLKKGLACYDQGRMTEAAWEWRFLFEIHWGQHLTGAQRALHWYFSKVDILDSMG